MSTDGCASTIFFFERRHPADLGAREISGFVPPLAVDLKVSASTQTRVLSALPFLYREVLALPIVWVDEVEPAKKSNRRRTAPAHVGRRQGRQGPRHGAADAPLVEPLGRQLGRARAFQESGPA